MTAEEEFEKMTGSDRHAVEQPCGGCGKPLLVENAWMEDGCPCNTPAGVNNRNLYRWKLLHDLQQNQSRELADCKEDYLRRHKDVGDMLERAIAAETKIAAALKAKEERVPICQATPLTVSRAIWDTAWLAYSKAHGGGQAQHDRLLRDGFYAGELDQFCPGWRPIDQRITTLEKAKEEAERTADITMTGFGKLEEKFREQVLRAEKAERRTVYKACPKHQDLAWNFMATVAIPAVEVCPHCERDTAIDEAMKK